MHLHLHLRLSSLQILVYEHLCLFLDHSLAFLFLICLLFFVYTVEQIIDFLL